MGKLLTISFFLTLLLRILSMIFKSSIINILFSISTLIFTTCIFIIIPILDYKKSEDKKLRHLIYPVIFIGIILLMPLYYFTENLVFFVPMCILIFMLILIDIFKTKEISIANILLIATLILAIMTNVLYLHRVQVSLISTTIYYYI